MDFLPVSFGDFVQLGMQHIADFAAFDHMLFLAALCAAFTLKDWRRAVALITAFTIGHSITLITAGLALFSFDQGIIEFLIPVTIIFMALKHWLPQKNESLKMSFGMCMIFGFIHGMGFSTYIRMMSSDEGLIANLLAFNLGVEVGQIMIVTGFLGVATLLVVVLKVNKKLWTRIVSGLAILVASVLMVQNWPF